MPVLPDDGSSNVCPGVRTPSVSACSIIASAMRSFTDPPGFWPSSLASSRTRGFGVSWLTSTSGVLPIRSRTLPYCTRDLAAGDGGQDRDLVAVGDLGVELVGGPDVLVVDVDVQELVQRAVGVAHLLGQPRELEHEVVEDLTDGAAVGLDRRLAPGVLAHHRWDPDLDGHVALLKKLTRSVEILATFQNDRL